MKREILNLKEYDLIPLIDEYWKEIDDYIEIENGEWDNFELINSELDYYNLEDSYDIINHVIKRLSDGKYFKFYSKYNYQEYTTIPNQEIYEVFPKKVEITIYE